MEKFEIQNGEVGISDEKIKIKATPVIGIKRLYRRHKIILLLIMLACISFLTISYYTSNIYYKILAFFLVLFVIFYSLSLLLARFGIISSTVTIPRESIKNVMYNSNNGLRAYRLHIKYMENEQEKSKSVWVSLFESDGEDRLDSAIQALRKSDIEPKKI